jgi:hypothetical protein
MPQPRVTAALAAVLSHVEWKKMKRLSILFVVLLLISCSRGNMSETDFNQLVKESNSYMLEKIDKCVAEYKIGAYKHFNWNQQTGELVWSDDGVPRVIAKIQFVGSISTKSNTWLWSWANPTILADMKKDMIRVKAFGEQHHFEKLTTEGWPAEEADGWEMTAVAAKVLQARGVYRAPDSSGDGYTFFIIKELYWAKR